MVRLSARVKDTHLKRASFEVSTPVTIITAADITDSLLGPGFPPGEPLSTSRSLARGHGLKKCQLTIL